MILAAIERGGAIKLIDQKPVSAAEIFRLLADGIGEIDGLLVDDELLPNARMPSVCIDENGSWLLDRTRWRRK